MKWPTVPLKEIAPVETVKLQFSPDEAVWHLTLDQIESHTGYIVNKRSAPVSKAGTSTYVFDEGNVLYSKLRPYLNKVVCPSEPGIATTELVPLRPHKGILDRRYLTYYLRSSHFLGFANVAVAGVKMPRIIMPKFWKHQVPLPPLSEQLQIVEILDQADALRKKRAEADSKATRILPALFYKMFGDPATNPKGWNTGSLGDVILETQYGTSTKANTSGDGLPVLRMNNIDSDGYLDLTDLKYVMLSAKENEKYALTNGDILFNRTNSKELVGKTGLWLGEMEVVAASYLIRVRVDQERAIPEFIWAYMNCPFIKQMLLNRCRRAIGMANINAKELRNLPLILPKRDRQVAFAEHFDGLEQLRSQRKQNPKAIDRLFDTLLYRAFTGDLTAKWREARMKELLEEMEAQARVLNEKVEP
jgi:type I restriction enzyme S subunit